MAHEVFIGYSTEDKAVADAVCSVLESRNIRCWIAPRDVPPGKFGGAIMDAVGQSRILVFVFSANSNTSANCLSEVHTAFNKKVTIIPLRIDNTTPSEDMEYYLQTFHWLDAVIPPLEKHLQMLAEMVEVLLTQAAAKAEQAAKEKARKEAEATAKEKARQEAEAAKAMKEAERARQEVEAARAKQEAEEAKKAQEAARVKKEAEEAAREKVRQEAETTRARKEAEVAAKERARREAEATRIKKEAEEAAKEKARWEEETARARQEAEEAKKARGVALKAKKEAEKVAKEKAQQEAEAARARQQAEKGRRRWVKPVLITSGLVVIIAVVVIGAIYSGLGRPGPGTTGRPPVSPFDGAASAGPGASISGYVYDVQGQPIAGASVDAFVFETGQKGWHAQADNSGHYQITGVPAGNYCVSASAVGRALTFWKNTTQNGKATPVPVTVLKDTTDINFNMEPGGYISGMIRNVDGSATLSNISVECRRTIDTGDKDWHAATADSSGKYTISGLPYGDYVVRSPGGGRWGAGDANFVIEIYNNKASEKQANLVTVASLVNPGGINFTVATGSSISGRVYQSDNMTPVANCHVYASDFTTNQWMSGVNTDASGHYTLHGLPAGSYRVRASASLTGLSYVDEIYKDTYAFDKATPVTVTLPNDTPNIDFSLEPGATISGHVSASDGFTPVAGAKISIIDYDSAISGKRQTLSSTQTDARGDYAALGVPTGTYGVCVEAGGYASEWYGGNYLRDKAAPVKVHAPDNTKGIDFRLEAGSSISGYVYESDGKTPVTNCNINANDFATDVWMAGANTDASGRYNLIGLPAGSYRVRTNVYNSGLNYVDKFYKDTYFWDKTTPVMVTLSNATANINFTLDVGGTISGHVYTSDGGKPVAGAKISVIDYNSISGRWLQPGGGQTDKDGYYVTTGIPAGTYGVFVQVQGFASEWYGGNYFRDKAAPVNVRMLVNTPGIDFGLEPGGSISGYIYQYDEKTPIANCNINANDFTTDIWMAGTNTNASGYYILSGLPDGSYRVRSNAFNTNLNYIDEYYKDTYLWDKATPVIVTLINNTSSINFALDIGGTISGTVWDDVGGKPISNISVDCSRADGVGSGGATTDQNGNYTLTGLPYGKYKVGSPSDKLRGSADGSFAKQFYNKKADSGSADLVTVSAQNPRAASIDFRLVVGGSILGRVTDEAGNALTNADVWTEYWTGGSASSTRTDAQGNYAIRNLPSGNYRVMAKSSGRVQKFYSNTLSYQSATPVSVTISNDTPSINFALEPGGTISGTVRDKVSGKPMANVSVDCSRADGVGSGGATTDQNGNYTLTGLPYGKYKVGSPGDKRWGSADDGYTRQFYNSKTDGSNADLVTISTQNPNAANINFNLTK